MWPQMFCERVYNQRTSNQMLSQLGSDEYVRGGERGERKQRARASSAAKDKGRTTSGSVPDPATFLQKP